LALEDRLYPFRNLYRASPAWLRHSVGRLYATLPMRVRYGRALSDARRLLDRSQWWSWEQHRAYQWKRMQHLLRHAYKNVPYYRQAMDEAHLTPEDIQSIEDWQKLPLLDRDLVRRHKEGLVAENMRHRTLAVNTGGSSGQPLELYFERGRTRSLERAFMWRQWAWAGFRYGDRTAVVRGQVIRRGLWRYDPLDRHLFINSYQMTDENMSRVVQKLREFAPLSIQAYPSALAILAGWMKRHDEPPIESVTVLLCGSEGLYHMQKELFSEVFQARVYNWYGHTESCCLAGYCENEDYYHVYSEYGHTELIDSDGNVVPWTEGQQGEIIATGFINHAMPLIRYRTGDIAVAGPAECPCGRRYRLLKAIQGRTQEYIVTAEGRTVPLNCLVFGGHWHALAHIRRLQFIQDEPGKLVARIIKAPGFHRRDEEEIRDQVLAAVPSGLELGFEYVDHVPLTPRGKHVFLRQSLSLPSACTGGPPRALQERVLR
jgi:phenylacetate-CoA ligase